MKTYKQLIEEIGYTDVKEMEKFGQNLFNKVKGRNVNFRVATHSFDRFNDSRNESPINKSSVIRLFKKGIPQVVKGIDDYMNKKVCLIDKKTNLNIPLTITDGDDGTIFVNTNSAQNKEDYWLPKDQIPIYVN